MLQRAPSVQSFWDEHHETFRTAWAEWENAGGHNGISIDRSIYAPALRRAIELSWEDPNEETQVRDLWTEVFPNVYQAQFFDPEQLSVIGEYLDHVWAAGIPLRPPYGIVLNRGGAMLDPRSQGYLAAPTFQAFYRDLMDRFMRPVGRLLFPGVYGYDTQSFGFSVQWQAGKDVDLRPHTDASSVTLNINLNLPGESFSGSAVTFWDQSSRRRESLTFEPGVALMHHGRVPHASEAITEGERRNLIFWLYGEHGQIPQMQRQAARPLTAHERWRVPEVQSDGFAPF